MSTDNSLSRGSMLDPITIASKADLQGRGLHPLSCLGGRSVRLLTEPRVLPFGSPHYDCLCLGATQAPRAASVLAFQPRTSSSQTLFCVPELMRKLPCGHPGDPGPIPSQPTQFPHHRLLLCPHLLRTPGILHPHSRVSWVKQASFS